MSKLKIELKVNMYCAKCKADVLKAIAKLEGIDELTADLAKEMVVVIGEVDPVCVVSRVRKIGKRACIVSVVPHKKPEKKEEEKKPEKKEEEKKPEKKEEEKKPEKKEEEKKPEKKEEEKKPEKEEEKKPCCAIPNCCGVCYFPPPCYGGYFQLVSYPPQYCDAGGCTII